MIKKRTGEHVDVSRLFVYYNSRKQDKKNDHLPPIITDTGCPIIAAIEALKKRGVCLESIWPYDEKKVNIKPQRQCYKAAKQNAIIEALEVDANIDEMRSCLAQGFPIIFGLDLYPSFNRAESNGGAVPMPKSSKTSKLS
jgi:hypothetical protein